MSGPSANDERKTLFSSHEYMESLCIGLTSSWMGQKFSRADAAEVDLHIHLVTSYASSENTAWNLAKSGSLS